MERTETVVTEYERLLEVQYHLARAIAELEIGTCESERDDSVRNAELVATLAVLEAELAELRDDLAEDHYRTLFERIAR